MNNRWELWFLSILWIGMVFPIYGSLLDTNCRTLFPKPPLQSTLFNRYCFDPLCDSDTEFMILKDAAEIYTSNQDDQVLVNQSILIDGHLGIILSIAPWSTLEDVFLTQELRSSVENEMDIHDMVKIVDLQFNATVFPGLVGMHEHLFYPAKQLPLQLYSVQVHSAPLLYLARGVTTARTTGSMHPYADLSVTKMVEEGNAVGPRFLPTAPYLNGKDFLLMQFYQSPTVQSTLDMMKSWRVQGFDQAAGGGWKAYMTISRDQLAAAVENAHQFNERITGHLCSVTFHEAIDRNIDNLEHGLIVASDFVPGKIPDQCPLNVSTVFAELDLQSAPVQDLIDRLVCQGVAVTSTLAVFESMVPNRPPLSRIPLDALIHESKSQYLTFRAANAVTNSSIPGAGLLKEMEFERMFVEKGGLLMAGADPTAAGGVVAGYADLRNLELLVEAGFSVAQAISIASRNGATYLGGRYQQCTGTIEAGRLADLVVTMGKLSEDISQVQNVFVVFKDGIAYDSQKLEKAAQDEVSWV